MKYPLPPSVYHNDHLPQYDQDNLIADNPELADELEAKIMKALHDSEGTAPKAKASKASSTKDEDTADSKDNLDDFDESIPDDFSIEEDIRED